MRTEQFVRVAVWNVLGRLCEVQRCSVVQSLEDITSELPEQSSLSGWLSGMYYEVQRSSVVQSLEDITLELPEQSSLLGRLCGVSGQLVLVET